MRNATHRFAEEDLKKIAFMAKKQGISRSAVVRESVREKYANQIIAPIVNGRSPKKCP